MPVQINEVVIRAVVDSKPSAATGNTNIIQPGASANESEITERILEIIKEKQER